MEASVQLHALAAEPPGKEPQAELDRRLGGAHSRSGRRGIEKGSKPNLFSVCGALDVMLRLAVNFYAVFQNRNSVSSEIFDVILEHDLL
jgi:hypothetical protein